MKQIITLLLLSIILYSCSKEEPEKEITSIVWHELTHASQVVRMQSDKGKTWGDEYWSMIVYQEVKNSLKTGGSYGKKGDDNWQIIALAEGWANYRQWYLSNKHLGENDLGYYYDYYGKKIAFYFDDYSSVAVYYGGMFDRLNKIGCSFLNLEKSLCTYSISGFKDNIVAKYPTKKEQISNIIKSYE